MERIFSKPTHRYRIFVAAFLALAFIGITVSLTHRAHAESSDIAADEHIITVHDDGVDKGFITKKSTLREAFATENIRLDANDRTEPGLDEKLVATSYQVNIYRARPVVIRDGERETKIVTSYRTAKQIAQQAKITLHDADQTTLQPSTDPLADGAAEVMHITRATAFIFEFYGKVSQDYTMAKTVGEMLKEKHISMGAQDGIEPAASAVVTPGMKIKLWRNGIQTITVDEDVAFDTKQIKDVDHDKGYKQVQTPGEKGKRTVTYEINMQNGIEVSRKEINSNITKQPIQQVEVVGTKVNLPAGSHQDWMAAAGISPSDYGYAEYIIGRESGWNPNSVNKSSGACGLVQAYPCSKLGPNWNDPIVALQWANGYVGRYGGWAGAYAHWQQYNSY